jgi:hypothetical protein
MKKIAFFLIVITMISCDSDDDSTPTDPLVGVWDLNRSFVNDEEQIVGDCERLSLIQVFENGFYDRDDYNYDDITDSCNSFHSDDAVQVTPNSVTRVLTDYPNAAWENQGDGNYKFTLEASGPVKNITLETSNTTFSFTESVGDSIYKRVYIKVPSI